MSDIADYVQFLGTNKELNTPAIHVDTQSSQRGFTLLEVLIAATLVAFGMLAVGQLLFTSAATIDLARSREAAVLAAHNKLEYLCGLYLREATHPDLAAGEHGPHDVAFRNPNDSRILDMFRITWSVRSVPDPRPEWKNRAVLLTVASTPIRSDGTPMDRPYSGRTVVLTAVLGSQTK